MTEPEIAMTDASAGASKDAAPIIEMTGVSKWYGDIEVLKGIDFRVAPGERVVICGPSGSGKSTAIRCINRLEQHQQGQIFVEGVELTDQVKNIDHVRREVGMVFQQFNLFPHLTVLQNCMLAPMHTRGASAEEAEATAMKYLQRVRIPEQAAKYPSQLSGGQQQRVAIARALCMNPKIMLFDEPTSALDPELVGEVLKVMRGLAGEGRTMLVVTHEMEFAREVASQLVFLHQGLIEEQGAPREVLARPQSARLQQFLAGGLK